MRGRKNKPFYGMINFSRANIVTIILFIFGFLISYIFSFYIGLIILFLGLYSLFSFIVSTISINPMKSIDYSNMFELKGNEKVLDVGCGLGRSTIGIAKLIKTGKVIGVDIWDKVEIPGNSAERAYKNAEIENVRKKIEFKYGDVFNLKFKDNSFDVVICSGLITAFHKDFQKIKAMKEIYRVLKPNGIFLMREPVKKLKTLIILTPDIYHIRLPSKKQWIELLKQSGFVFQKYYTHRISGSFKMKKPKLTS
jgi:ubiquinone/menaquinone biosynthesis C-methylase UbiE